MFHDWSFTSEFGLEIPTDPEFNKALKAFYACDAVNKKCCAKFKKGKGKRCKKCPANLKK